MEHFLTHPLLTHRIAQFAHGDDDARQFICLRLLEVAAADPTFAGQAPGFHVKRAAWSRRHYAERDRNYSKYVSSEPHVLDPDGEELVSWFDEYLPSPCPTPEDAILHAERLADIERAIDSLRPVQRRIVRLLAAGFEPSAIAGKLGLSRSNVSHYIRRIRIALSASL